MQPTIRKKGRYLIEVEVSNVTARTISIPTKSIMAELQPVTIVPQPVFELQPTEEGEDLIQKVVINPDLSAEQRNQCVNILQCWF